ncbi:GntR family transcriptional regulator [Niallia sp. NCCP-28]|uniref:GntR family transcriptional regulator n=1 Tax=Niallia sp. NCCP-28 TaxID=2934712 RepID=UPI002088853F|nr:GntR family transcriptional regulator [Niallia sp. NCCP-28]GKU84776.1 GntR family transcriptional regulator [Niallia sp. NCCP-28]
MFELDLRSRTPIYEQLVDKLIELIVSGVMVPDEQLPSVRTLAAQLTINPNTIQKAYRELETKGYIYSIKGKGSFVNASNLMQDENKLKEAWRKLEKLISEALFLGIKPEDIIELVEKLKEQKGGTS